MSWSKRLTHLLYSTLLPSCLTSDGYACRNSWSCHEADSEEGRKADSAIGRALVMPFNLPQLQPRLQNEGPLTLPCPNPPPCLHLWPCCGPHPSHHFLLTGPPAHTHTLTLTMRLPQQTSDISDPPFSPFLPLLVDWVWDWTRSILCPVDSANASPVRSP